MMSRNVERNRRRVEASVHRFWRGSSRRVLQLFAVVAAVIGIALRIRMFLENRSLWLDPAMLAMNVVNKDAGELLGRLDMNQAAPAGFLLSSKAIGSIFDYTEYSLYLAPCLLGIGALLLFIWLAIAVLGPTRAPLAYLPMATCSTAIFYCGEFRPQSADLFFSVLTLLAAHAVLKRNWALSAIAAFAAVGVVGVWFSYGVFFVIAGSGIALVLLALTSATSRPALRMMIAFAVVMLHFLVLYLLHIRPSIGPDLYTANTAAFAPVVAAEKGQLWWWILAVTGYFEYPLGFRGFIVVPMLGCITGVVLCVVNKRYLAVAAVVGTPMFLVFVASGLGMYPIATGLHEVKSRFVLFTVPIALLFIAIGVSRLCEWLGGKKILAALVVALFLIPSVYGAWSGPVFRGQEIRPLTRYLERHFQPGDTVYVFHASIPAFRFYTRHNHIEAVFGRPPRGPSAGLAEDLRRVRNADRLWVVVSHAYGGERRVLRRALRRMGTIEKTHRYPGAVLFECSLSN
jgi:hypothetical protein